MTLSEMMNEYKLENSPNDCIQSIKFGLTNSQLLLVASWDNYVRLYDIQSKQLKAKYNHNSPVLDCTFQVMYHYFVLFFFFSCFLLLVLSFLFFLGYTSLMVRWL